MKRLLHHSVQPGCLKFAILFLAIALCASYAMRRSGVPFIASDAQPVESTTVTYATKDAPISITLSPTSRTLYGFLLTLRAPEEASSDTTTVRLSRDGDPVYEKVLNNDDASFISYKSDESGDAVRERWTEFDPDSVIDLGDGHTWTIEITSSATDEKNAYGFYEIAKATGYKYTSGGDDAGDGKTTEEVYEASTGEVWSVLLYQLLSNTQRLMLTVLFFTAVCLVLWLCLYFGKAFQKPENIFLLFSLLLGGLYLFLTSPYITPDSANHFVRAYTIAHGQFLVPEGGLVSVPENIIVYRQYAYTPYIALHTFHTTLNAQDLVPYNISNFALYSPYNHVLTALGIGIADLFTDNVWVLYYTGSLFNLFGCTAIIYLAIRAIPTGKALLSAIALMPMMLELRSSLSGDAFTNAMVIAILAFCVCWCGQDRTMTRRDLALMYVTLFFVSSCKVIYFISAFLVWIIPNARFRSRKSAFLHKILATLETLVLSLGWIAIASNYLGSTRAGGDAAQKVSFILHQPVRYVYIMIKTLWEDGAEYLLELYGYKLGLLNIVTSELIPVLGIALLFALFIAARQNQPSCARRAGLWSALIAAGIFVLVDTSLYLQWTSLAASTYSIEGLQGRYYIPALLFAFFALLIPRGKKSMPSPDPRSRSLEVNLLYGNAVLALLELMELMNYCSYLG